jgi:prepilin-type N-terminal cleavage/methylation domain-containing protein
MKSLKLQRGMSLVELLVALAIGAFLIIGAVTVQSQTRKTFSVNEQQARLQETARFVLSVIEPDVQLAGLYGFSNIPDGVRMSVDGNIQYASDMRTNKAAIEGMPAVLDKCGANYVVDVTAAIQADDGSWTYSPCAARASTRSLQPKAASSSTRTASPAKTRCCSWTASHRVRSRTMKKKFAI